MVDLEKRRAIFLLHQEGMSTREIGRRLRISRKTIRKIIAASGESSKIVHQDRVTIDEEKLVALFSKCQGYVQRMYEILQSEGVEIGYSTLTHMVRDLELGKPEVSRAERYPDEPGKEMQHDTSPFIIEIVERKTSFVCSQIYLRYSKRRFMKFYPSFNRFRMKCFLHEALIHFGFSAKKCIIDNTHLAVLRGSGSSAVFVPEMNAFAEQYGFKWLAHAIKHSDRKAGVEKSFHFVETNFLPGRTFKSLEDLNQQALTWATVDLPLRPLAKTKLIPAQLFEFEKPYLTKLLPALPAPFIEHERIVDQYGYTAFEGNYFWVPEKVSGDIKVLQYSQHIFLYKNREKLIEYPLPPYGARNEKIRPEGKPLPRVTPKNCKHAVEAEEKRLMNIDPVIAKYLNDVKERKAAPVVWTRFIRALYNLSLKLSTPLMVKTIERATTYRVTDLDAIERIAMYLLREDSSYEIMEFFYQGDPELEKREAYQSGSFTEEPSFEKYNEEMNKPEGGETDNGQGS